MAERSLNNFGDYPDAAERYLRMALKAQAQCRATIEVLDRMDRGGTQTIKHVHVDNRGGQTVIADRITTGGGAKWEKHRTMPCSRVGHIHQTGAARPRHARALNANPPP